jgi:HAD superfamily hydrolase (TIGR01509 family)
MPPDLARGRGCVSIQAVVCDMDDVLCRYRIDRRLARLAEWSGRAADEIHAAIWRSGFEDASERGEWQADDYLTEFGARMGYPLTIDQWVEARRIAVEPDEAVLEVARRLAARLPVGMLTNNGFLLKRHIGEVFPAVPAIFGANAVFSAELGCAKPDPEAFRRLARRLGVAPERLLFFDDGARYVAGAREAGVEAHLFQGVDALRATLRSYGLDV